MEGVESVDLVFVDGGHRFEDVIVDLICAVRLLRAGGALVIDDVNPSLPGVLQAANFVRRNFAQCLALVEDSPLCATASVFVKTAALGVPATEAAWNFHVPF